MKTITTFFFGALLLMSFVETASAQVYYTFEDNYRNQQQNYYGNQYQGNWNNQNTRGSYTYTSGCTTYYYDGYTNITSVIGSNCQNNQIYPHQYTQTVTVPQVTYYTEPAVIYTNPVQAVYYTEPARTTNYPSSYYTYQYKDNAWYSPYDTRYSSTPSNYLCFSLYGLQACY